MKPARKIHGYIQHGGSLSFRLRRESRVVQNTTTHCARFNGALGEIVGTFYDAAPTMQQRRIAERQGAKFFMAVGVRNGVLLLNQGTTADALYNNVGHVQMCGTWQGYLGLEAGSVRWLKVRLA